MSDLAASIAAWGLPTAHRLPLTPVDESVFNTLIGHAEHHRVLGLVGVAVRAGDFPVTAEQATVIEDRWAAWLGHSLRVEQLVIELASALQEQGIDALAAKGVALAHVAYPHPEWRVYGDVDLLIEPGRFSDAMTTIVRRFDGERAQPELRSGFDERFGREILVRVGRYEVDLHRTFVDGAYGLTVHLDDLFETPTPFSIGEATIAALAPAPRAMHAAYAATLSDWPPRLIALRDLAQIVTHSDPDPDAVLALARRWRAEGVLATAMRSAWRQLCLTTRPALLEWAEQHRLAARDRLVLASYRGRARGYTSQAASLLVLRGIRDRVGYVRALAFPSPEYRAARGLDRLGLLRAGARKARRS
jgi:hypothetical protein